MALHRGPHAGRLFDVFNYAFLTILGLAMLYPFWETLVVSVMPPDQAISLGLKVFPRVIRWEAYRMAFSSKLIRYGYLNTILRTSVGTVLTVFLSFCTAYPLAKRQLPARKAFTIFYLIPMFFQGGLIPSYLLVRSLGMINTRWALIVPVLLGTYNLLIMRNFIMSIPESVEESASLDGASFFRILVSLIIPLSVPIMATIALWVAVSHWNAWFDAMIYVRDETKTVLQLVLRRVVIDQDTTAMAENSDSVTRGESVVSASVQAATVIVSIGPILLSYPFVQRYFVKGIMIGSLKG
jgi:putative aldouronate transport system permease protein